MDDSLIGEVTKIIPNKYLLCNFLSTRIKQLASGVRPTIDASGMNLFEVAARELTSGNLKVEKVSVEEEEE